MSSSQSATNMARDVKVLHMDRIVHHDERVIAEGDGRTYAHQRGAVYVFSCVCICICVDVDMANDASYMRTYSLRSSLLFLSPSSIQKSNPELLPHVKKS
jgi:hypothetical protein